MRVQFSEYSTIGFYASEKQQPWRACSSCDPVRVYRFPSRVKFFLCFGTVKPEEYSGKVFLLGGQSVGLDVNIDIIETDTNGDGNAEYFMCVSLDTTGDVLPGQQPTSSCNLYMSLTIGDKVYYSDDFRICLNATWSIEAWNNCDDPKLGPASTQSNDTKRYLDFMDLSFAESTFDETITTKASFEGPDINTSIKKKIFNSAVILGDESLFHAMTLLNCFDNIEIKDRASGCSWIVSEFSVTKGANECKFPLTFTFLKAIFEKGRCCFDAFQTPFESCTPLPCIPPEIEILCNNCVLSVNILSSTLDGYALSWCGPDNSEIGTGEILDLNEIYGEDQAPSGIYTLKATNPNCEDVTATYEHSPPNPGTGSHTVIQQTN